MEVRPGNYNNWEKPIDSTKIALQIQGRGRQSQNEKILSGGFGVQLEKMVETFRHTIIRVTGAYKKF